MSELIKKTLKERGIKQNWIAQKIGVSNQAISNWLSGVMKFPAGRRDQINKLLNITDD